jgi:hypothetical protein
MDIVTNGGLQFNRMVEWTKFNRFPFVFDFVCGNAKLFSQQPTYARRLSSKDNEVSSVKKIRKLMRKAFFL